MEKIFEEPFKQRIHVVAMKVMNICSILLVIMKIQTKTQGTSINLLEWVKLKILITLSIGKDQLKFSYIKDGNVKWCSHFAKHFGI